MTLVLNGKGLLLEEGSTRKIEDKQVPGCYTLHASEILYRFGIVKKSNRTLNHRGMLLHPNPQELQTFTPQDVHRFTKKKHQTPNQSLGGIDFGGSTTIRRYAIHHMKGQGHFELLIMLFLSISTFTQRNAENKHVSHF